MRPDDESMVVDHNKKKEELVEKIMRVKKDEPV
jgi:hypothetical protein